MNSANSILLNRFFTRNTFKQIVEEGESSTFVSTIHKYIPDFYKKTNEECIHEIYQYLKNEYQNEYYFKNTLLNKLLLGVHSTHTTTALTEFPVEKSKADFVLINGKAVVYEIKTDLDNLVRLDSQINNYYKAFSSVMVVTSEKNYHDVYLRLQNTPAGISILTKKETLSIRKKPDEYCEALSNTTMFKALRKSEYENIIINHFGELPSVSQFDFYRTCKALFESLSTDVAYKLFIQTLKKRGRIDNTKYSQVPYELKFLVYFSDYTNNDYEKLSHFLNI